MTLSKGERNAFHAIVYLSCTVSGHVFQDATGNGLSTDDAPLAGVFAAVAVEASVLLGDVSTSLVRYDDAETGVVVAVSRTDIPVGLRFPVGFRPDVETGPSARSPAPLRLASMQGTPGESAAAALGVTSVVAIPVVVEGRVWGMLNAIGSREPPPPGTEERLAPFAELAAAAIANAENRDTLRASRARIVASADEARRRLQRDVHDTAQQRLVHATIALKLARRAAGAGEDPTDLLDEALRHAERAATDLRDVVHGILPAALNHGGLGPGLESLVDDLALPVELQVSVPRLPVTTETTAYFVVAEALANVVKHASATHATVVARLEGQALVVDVRDDGRGGADPARGTGLTGLLDRVEAGDGVLTVSSPPGAGTVVHIELPVGPGHTPPGQRDAGD